MSKTIGNVPDPMEIAPEATLRMRAACLACRARAESGTANEDDRRAFLDAVMEYTDALGIGRADVREQIAQGRYRSPGFVVLDEVGYDRHLAKRSVGPGWAGLIDEVFDFRERRARSVRIVQVKEKFAALTIYVAGETRPELERLSDLIDVVERRSETICERCGRPRFVREGGWFKTLCDEHAEGRPRAEGR